MKREQTNPYIPLVLEHDKIMVDTEDMYAHKGKWKEFFAREGDIVLEIGTGLGNFFSRLTSENPDKNSIGMEIKYKRLYKTATKSLEKGAENFVLLKDFGQNVDKIFGEGEISDTYVFFPDPWGKKDRQKKHRLFREEFIKNLYKVTKPGGKLIFKTDHREYFDTTLEVFAQIGLWKEVYKSNDYQNELSSFDKTNMTEFEQIFKGKRIEINYVEFER